MDVVGRHSNVRDFQIHRGRDRMFHSDGIAGLCVRVGGVFHSSIEVWCATELNDIERGRNALSLVFIFFLFYQAFINSN